VSRAGEVTGRPKRIGGLRLGRNRLEEDDKEERDENEDGQPGRPVALS
jgi:hypothetical protein